MKDQKILGIMNPVVFLVIFAVLVIGMFMEVIPDNMAGGFAICLIFGIGLNWIGNQVPVLNRYGLGTILVLLVPAILVYSGVFPDSVKAIVKNFFSGYDFSSFFVPGILVGSILGMERKTLLKAGWRFFIPMFSTIILVTILGGVVGGALGQGFKDTMLYIAGPILGSGVTASAVPLSEIYAGYSGGDPSEYITILSASVILANIMIILLASLLSSIGRNNPNFLFKGFYGDGKNVLRNAKLDELTEDEKDDVLENSDSANFGSLGVGFIVTCGILVAGRIVAKIVPGGLHYYLWMIVIALIIKVVNVFPKEVDVGAAKYGQFHTKVLTPVMLAAISFASLDIATVVKYLSQPSYFITILFICIVTILISGAIAYACGFYAVEGSIMAGMGLANAGGAGDIAVCSAADRMDLIPWLTISSRIGGAVNMAWLTWLAARVLGG